MSTSCAAASRGTGVPQRAMATCNGRRARSQERHACERLGAPGYRLVTMHACMHALAPWRSRRCLHAWCMVYGVDLYRIGYRDSHICKTHFCCTLKMITMMRKRLPRHTSCTGKEEIGGRIKLHQYTRSDFVASSHADQGRRIVAECSSRKICPCSSGMVVRVCIYSPPLTCMPLRPRHRRRTFPTVPC